jgi:hypothetical protein
VRPAFGLSKRENVVVNPGDEAQPQKFAFVRVSTAIFFGTLKKAWTALFQQRLHLDRNPSLGLNDQTHPIRKRAPLDVISNRLRQAVGIDLLPLRLSQSLRFHAESSLGFAELTGLPHPKSVR